MSETPVASGQEDQGSANDQTEEIQKPVPDSVAYETYRKVLSEKKRRDEELRTTRERLDTFEKAERDRKEKEALDREDFQSLLKMKEDEANEYKNKYATVLDQHVKTAKLTAFLDSLEGRVSKKYWNMIPLETIKLDQDSGEIDQNSLTLSIERFKKEYPEVIQGIGGPKTPTQAPQSAVGKPSPNELFGRLANLVNQNVGG